MGVSFDEWVFPLMNGCFRSIAVLLKHWVTALLVALATACKISNQIDLVTLDCNLVSGLLTVQPSKKSIASFGSQQFDAVT